MLNLESKLSNLPKRKKSILIPILLVFLLTSLLSGCNGEEPAAIIGEENISEGIPKGKINAPVQIKYTVKNPLELVETLVNEEENQGFSYSSMQVSGLKDKDVEKVVNEKLKAAYEEMLIRDLPAYRGIKVKIPEGSQVIQEDVYTTVSGSFNNVLSAQIGKYTTYATPNRMGEILKTKDDFYENTQYIYEVETINLDLNTGEEITLDRVFCDNIAYLEIINDYVKEQLYANHADEEGYFFTMDGGIKLVEPFKGFTEDLKFAIQPHGIVLYLDDSTPQFDIGFTCQQVYIYFNQLGDNIAIGERYYKDNENIFESTKPIVKSLVSKNMLDPVGGENHYQDGEVNVFTNWRCSSLMPEKIQNLVKAYANPDKETINILNNQAKSLDPKDLEFSGGGYYEGFAYADAIGNYINVSTSNHSSVGKYFYPFTEYKCFDEISLKELELGDLFIEGYDYKPVLIKAIERNLKESYDQNGNPLEDVFNGEDIEEIYKDIKGFNLSVDAMHIPVILADKSQGSIIINMMINYEEFGCQNMKIFN